MHDTKCNPLSKLGKVAPRRLRHGDSVLALGTMATEALDTALDRIEQALARLEGAVARQADAAAQDDAAAAELGELRSRHRKLKDTVAQELRQLDLLLANLPNPRG